MNVSVHRGEHADCAQAGEALSLFQSGDTTVLEVQEGHRLGSVGLAHIKDQQQRSPLRGELMSMVFTSVD